MEPPPSRSLPSPELSEIGEIPFLTIYVYWAYCGLQPKHLKEFA
jgi:hypothetical protein